MRLLLLLALAPLATGDVLPPRPAVRLDAAPRPHELRPVRGAAPVLLAAKKKPAAAGHSDMAAAGSIAGIALACEIFQYINTGLFFFTLQRLTGAGDPSWSYPQKDITKRVLAVVASVRLQSVLHDGCRPLLLNGLGMRR